MRTKCSIFGEELTRDKEQILCYKSFEKRYNAHNSMQIFKNFCFRICLKFNFARKHTLKKCQTLVLKSSEYTVLTCTHFLKKGLFTLFFGFNIFTFQLTLNLQYFKTASPHQNFLDPLLIATAEVLFSTRN